MKNTIKNHVLKNCSTTENISETIYIIDGVYVDGEYDCGSRGLDHNALIGGGYGWVELLRHGTVIVPETLSYISDLPIIELNELGYERLPLNDNHIVGYK